MARVFVSYASEDLALAHEVHRWLVEVGHEVFLDRGPHDGIAIDEQRRQRLRLADAVICVVTSAALVSPRCTAEIETAQSLGSRLLPLSAGPDLIHPLLTEVPHTDITTNSAAAPAALVQALRRIDAAGGSGWPDDRCPFPGLRPFNSDEHRVFFGREDEINQLAERVRSAGEGTALLVVGPLGCGKSSLVRAGLVPVMAAEPGWQVLSPILPGTDPMGVLARELVAAAKRTSLGWTVAHVRDRLGESGFMGLADELLAAGPVGSQRRLLVVVDQFEELLTLAGPDQRAQFVELLRPALTGPVRVVGTLRTEFLDRLLADPDLATLSTDTYLLRPLHHEALHLVIEGPAQLAGIDVEADLVARMIDDTDTRKSLPLLAFTLARLADGVGRGGRLSTARYDELGGVREALARQADVALKDAVTKGGRRRKQVIDGVLRLVTDEQGHPTRRRIRRDNLPARMDNELEVFVASGLLTADADNRNAMIGVAHEAFLSAWPPLAKAIAAKTHPSQQPSEGLVRFFWRSLRSRGRHPGLRYWLPLGLFFLFLLVLLFVLNGIFNGWRVSYEVSVQIMSPWYEKITCRPLALLLALVGWLVVPSVVGALVGYAIVQASNNRRTKPPNLLSSDKTQEGERFIPRLKDLRHGGHKYNIPPDFVEHFVGLHEKREEWMTSDLWAIAQSHWERTVGEFLNSSMVDKDASSSKALGQAVQMAASFLLKERCPYCPQPQTGSKKGVVTNET